MDEAIQLALITILLALIIGYIGFRSWLNHDRRRMIHRERLVAIEKGIPLPQIEQEIERRTWNVQRFLLLAGCCWIVIGIGGFFGVLFLSSGNPTSGIAASLPHGSEGLAFIPVGIGTAHLITYWVGELRERRGK